MVVRGEKKRNAAETS